MAKLTINLLQADLLPKRPLLTLTRVVIVWAILLGLIIAWGSYNHLRVNQLNKQFQQLTLQQNQQQQLLDNLQRQVNENKADPKLLERLDTLKLVLANKKALHQQLTDQTKLVVSGFSSAMTDLANYHHQDVSLEKVYIYQDQLWFNGMAKKPEAVPQWLAGFKNSQFLSGKTFTTFSMKENEQGLTSFSVSSQPENGGGAR